MAILRIIHCIFAWASDEIPTATALFWGPAQKRRNTAELRTSLYELTGSGLQTLCNEILTAIPIAYMLGVQNPTVLYRTSLCDELTGSEKWSEMAAAELDVLLQANIWIFSLWLSRHIGFSTSYVVHYSKCFQSIAEHLKWRRGLPSKFRCYKICKQRYEYLRFDAAAILGFRFGRRPTVFQQFPLDCWTPKTGE